MTGFVLFKRRGRRSCLLGGTTKEKWRVYLFYLRLLWLSNVVGPLAGSRPLPAAEPTLGLAFLHQQSCDSQRSNVMSKVGSMTQGRIDGDKEGRGLTRGRFGSGTV